MNSKHLPLTQTIAFNDRIRLRFRRKGFTLIELLIVIAIILILIAIALPNFLEAQIRARVARTKGEIRTLAIAMEAYYTDFQTYPAEHENETRGRAESGLFWLTSPIPYLTSIPMDPFGQIALNQEVVWYETGGAEKDISPPGCYICLETWVIFSRGPDLLEGDIRSADPHWEPGAGGTTESYAPTNGTKSAGDVFQYGGDPFWIGVRLPRASRSSYRRSPASFDVGLIVDDVFYLHRLPPPLR